MPFEDELQFAVELMERCGKVASALQAGGAESLQTTDKADDQGPVTRADTTVETMLVTSLRERFPEDAILAEESAATSDWRSHARVWMIDPIDGTKDFAAGDDNWAIHLCLTIDGVPTLGIVHEPGHNRTCWGIESRRAWCRRDHENRIEALHGLGRASPSWRMVTSKSHRSERLDAVMQLLDITPEQTLRVPSTGVKLSMVARGEAQLYVHPTLGTKLWDSAAPQVLLHAAGGRLTDMLGRPLRYSGPGVDNEAGLLATAPGVDHDAVVQQLAGLSHEWFS
jgi:3'(2'), 5'-bisphosphate nucleotidase